jgi:hypothetical protein
MREGDGIATGPWQGAAAGEDDARNSAITTRRPGPRPLFFRERLAASLEIVERTIARRRAERGMAA